MEAKSSLDKKLKTEILGQQDKTGHYSFPDIIEEKLSQDKKSDTQDNAFKRLILKSADGSLAEMEVDSAAIEKKAYAKGYAEGKIAGIQEENAKIAASINDFQIIISSFERLKSEIYKQSESNAVKIALAVAKKIVLREVSVNKDIILSVVKQALGKIMGQEHIKIKINPDDLQIIKKHGTDNSKLPFNKGIAVFEEDPEITCGGCVVETDSGDIDARIESQLLLIKEAFLDKVEQ